MSPNCFGISFTWKLALLVGETFKNPPKISLLKKSNRCTTIQGCKAVWIHGSLDSWQFGFMAVWIHGSLGSWQFGFMAVWFHDSLDSWQFGFMAVWIHGSLDSWLFTKPPIPLPPVAFQNQNAFCALNLYSC